MTPRRSTLAFAAGVPSSPAPGTAALALSPSRQNERASVTRAARNIDTQIEFSSAEGGHGDDDAEEERMMISNPGQVAHLEKSLLRL